MAAETQTRGVEPFRAQVGDAVVRAIDCPRCHQQCGWCSDYRWMHGVLKLPGTKRRCTVPGMEPEGDACPMCSGSRQVIATTTYQTATTGRRANPSPETP